MRLKVQVPGVKATDPWAGKYIGIQLLCPANLDPALAGIGMRTT